MNARNSPRIPVSWGELLDKITILQIKRARIADPAARANVIGEYELLSAVAEEATSHADVALLLRQLKAVNEDLWEIEDAIREQEERGQFGARFIRLARSVYKKNDERAALKRAINDRLQSALVEEKSYRHAARHVSVEER